jgi:hypothetical protein
LAQSLAEFGDHRRVGGILGEVLQFLRIGVVVVEFEAIGAAVPFGIAVALGATEPTVAGGAFFLAAGEGCVAVGRAEVGLGATRRVVRRASGR